jgi:hypothetical protein
MPLRKHTAVQTVWREDKTPRVMCSVRRYYSLFCVHTQGYILQNNAIRIRQDEMLKIN